MAIVNGSGENGHVDVWSSEDAKIASDTSASKDEPVTNGQSSVAVKAERTGEGCSSVGELKVNGDGLKREASGGGEVCMKSIAHPLLGRYVM